MSNIKILGKKLPVFCRYLNQPDHDILNHLNSDNNDGLNILYAPLIILNVCEKAYRESLLVNNRELYLQVLVDLDYIVSLLKERNENILASHSTKKTVEAVECDITLENQTLCQVIIDNTTSRSNSIDIIRTEESEMIFDLEENDAVIRLHKRSIHILEDLCILIGMRLALLDVISSIEIQDTFLALSFEVSIKLVDTLSRVISSVKLISCPYVTPVIEKTLLEATAVQMCLNAQNALCEKRYAEATILIFDFNNLVNTISFLSSASYDKGKISNNDGNYTNNDISIDKYNDDDISAVNIDDRQQIKGTSSSSSSLPSALVLKCLAWLTLLKENYEIVFKENIKSTMLLLGDKN